jgi:hypothetical protein
MGNIVTFATSWYEAPPHYLIDRLKQNGPARSQPMPRGEISRSGDVP